MKSAVDCNQKWYKLSGLFRGEMATIHSSRQTTFSFIDIEGITLGADEVMKLLE